MPTRSQEHELNQPRRIQAELAALGVRAILKRNDFCPAYLSAASVRTPLRQYDFCVYLDKDKYASAPSGRRGHAPFQPRRGGGRSATTRCARTLRSRALCPCRRRSPRRCAIRRARRFRGAFSQVGGVLGYPVVVKECYGSLGKGVYLAHDRASLRRSPRKSERVRTFPEFIAESAGQDLRVIVIGGKRDRRHAPRLADGFPLQCGTGRSGEKAALDTAGAALAERPRRRSDLITAASICCFGKDGPLVCEVNSNAFFGTFERVTGVNVAGLYADHILRTLEQTPRTEKNGKARFSET